MGIDSPLFIRIFLVFAILSSLLSVTIFLYYLKSTTTVTCVNELKVFKQSKDKETRSNTTTWESFVISLHPERIESFLERNHHSVATGHALWVAGVDGFHQPTLNMWSNLTDEYPAINVTNFDRLEHDEYDSPHAVGCYLAHWNLMRMLNHRPSEVRSDLYFVFEDDTSCVKDFINRTFELVQHLPPDWDILFPGGKPFTHYPKAGVKHKDSDKSTLLRDICRGDFGTADAPRAPDGSRNLSEDQPYWHAGYLTNTLAYVLNPESIDRVLEAVKPRRNAPIDIVLAEAMSARKVNAFMSPQEWCVAGPRLDTPDPWSGYVHLKTKKKNPHPALTWGSGSVWQNPLALGNCSY